MVNMKITIEIDSDTAKKEHIIVIASMLKAWYNLDETIDKKQKEKPKKGIRDLSSKEKPCITCGKLFTYKSNNAKYCSICQPKKKKKVKIPLIIRFCKDCGFKLENQTGKSPFCKSCKKENKKQAAIKSIQKKKESPAMKFCKCGNALVGKGNTCKVCIIKGN